ncbi:MAG: nucleotide exchange factor GrpE [Alphaproteobacteria bacterium]|nr:nucleotide exchange factor GrpE [Alphaproteobacteria bacterium]MBV8408495.1 nucleotide exchange factor GrpE [Alphaproteobacteria bacterium]
MASESTAGDEMPIEATDPSFDAQPQTEGESELQRLQAEKAELQDKLLRALAEAQNVRRRAQQDVERERKYGIERFAKDVLSVADNLGRALAALPSEPGAVDPAVRNVIVGIQATDRELQSVLERHGVTRIEALGKPFNADFHQAMMEIEDPTVPAGTVVQELIPGYLIAGRLLRAAMVGVAKGGPPARPASNEN